MPKCLECGFEAPRLQWTHFKYNCNGKFKNGTEYKKSHPGAILVDPELAKKTAITLENFIKKYGEDEGNYKWNKYRSKQAYTNTFEYKAKMHGWSKEDFDGYNSSRAVTFKNFVEKYGEIEGSERWDKYCELQRYTNSIEYYIEKYGDDGFERWNETNRLKRNGSDINFIMLKYEVDFAGAEEILAARSNNNISNNEMKFVDTLVDRIGDIKYTYKTTQFCIWSDELKSPLFYDVTCSEKRKIIEYNGDYWHCNPAITESNVIIKQNGMTAKEIWERDAIKHNTAKQRGFDVYVVWESDFLANPGDIINKIETWWNK